MYRAMLIKCEPTQSNSRLIHVQSAEHCCLTKAVLFNDNDATLATDPLLK